MTTYPNRHLIPALAVTACAGALLLAPAALAADIVWDGSEGDGFWTNGPQDQFNNPGTFPANGTTGANWTIDGGAAGQIVVPETDTPGGNLIDYLFLGHDWTINNAMIAEDVQVRLDGGSLNITNSTVSLTPNSSTGTGAFLSGLNLGQSGNATTAVFTDSTINLSRSNSNGRNLGISNGSSLSLVNTTINLSTEPGGIGEIDLANPGSSLTLDANSSVLGGGAIEVLNAEGFIDFNNATADLAFLRLNANGGPTSEDILLDFAGGTITVSDPNPLRGNIFEGSFNWTGDAGSGTVTHTDLSNNDSNLAGKTAQGFFSIDGTRVNPTIAQASDWTDQANIDAINAELLALAVNGKYLQITQDLGAGTQVIELLGSSLDPADLDQDGDVDDADFALFFAAFSGPGVPTGNPAADLDGDNDTDDADFGLAFAAFTGPGGAAAVPEPGSLALLALGGLALARRRRA